MVEPPTRDPIHTLIKHPNRVKRVSRRDKHTVASVKILLPHLFERSCLLDPGRKRLRDGSQYRSSERDVALTHSTGQQAAELGAVRVIGAIPMDVMSRPKAMTISTSRVERQSLTIRS